MGVKGERRSKAHGAPERIRLAAVGMEAELGLVVDGEPARPEDVFGDPRAFLPGRLLHREGTSYHLATGGAVYFDTGVIELATPVIELDAGCAARAGRSLWESLRLVREGLDAWERRNGRDVRLVGFSTHYNVSFERGPEPGPNGRTVEGLARLLAHVLPVPVMLLATNRLSTGVGVRPRGTRIEVTADFTPSAALMVATGTLITGIVRRVMTWPSFGLEELRRRRLPVVEGFEPVPHTSREGWLASREAYPRNPFACDVDADRWRTTDGGEATLREIAARITRRFRGSIRRVSDPFTWRLIRSVMRGEAPSLLDLDDRPPEYEDVGRLCTWNDLFPPEELPRSRYERVLIHAIAGRHLHLGPDRLVPVGMRGWSAVVFRRSRDGARHVISLDRLLGHLEAWEEGRPGREPGPLGRDGTGPRRRGGTGVRTP